MNHKDFFGNELQIGDEVAFMAPNYRMMVKGTVIDFTPKKIRLEYYNTWNYGKENSLLLTFLADSIQVIKKV